MLKSYTSEVNDCINTILNKNIDASKGLSEKLFFLVSSLTPIPNVDLLIINDKKEILLSWRDDEFYGQGWHIPGGCIRYGETMEQRIQHTSINELGCNVTFDTEPIAIRDIIRGENCHLKNPFVRGHNVTILFRCYLPQNYVLNNENLKETEPGYLRWFSHIPENLLKVHEAYGDVLYREILK